MKDLKKDYSTYCNFDDDDDKNNCWYCQYFLFPVGCMYGEEELMDMEQI